MSKIQKSRKGIINLYYSVSSDPLCFKIAAVLKTLSRVRHGSRAAVAPKLALRPDKLAGGEVPQVAVGLADKLPLPPGKPVGGGNGSNAPIAPPRLGRHSDSATSRPSGLVPLDVKFGS